MIRISSLAKSFQGKIALHNLNLEVAKGEIYGLLGHNGAGKSTTFGLMLGHLHPDRGEVFIGDHCVQRERAVALQRVGAIFEAPAFYEYLSGWRNLAFFVSLSATPPLNRMKEIVRLVGLEKRIQDPVRTYSHGMRQRLALAQALLPDPELILLDEPTEGLDPEGIHEIRELIRGLRDDRGLTVLLSSHLLPEVEQLCDRVAILKAGQLLFSGSWREVGDQKPRYRFDCGNSAAIESVFSQFNTTKNSDGTHSLPVDLDPAKLISALVLVGADLREASRVQPTLEDFYLRHTPL